MKTQASNNRTLNACNRFGQICLIIAAFWLVGCASSSRPTICGVPVQGSPWQLAAAIQSDGDGTFVPQCVELVTATKAYISGWLMPDEQPTTLICDLTEKGEVCSVALDCETKE